MIRSWKLLTLALFLALFLALPAHSETASPAPAAGELTQLLKEFLDGASLNDVAVHDRFWAEWRAVAWQSTREP